jgi:hypothetical protein
LSQDSLFITQSPCSRHLWSMADPAQAPASTASSAEQPGSPNLGLQEFGPSLSEKADPGLKVVVRNTFLDVVDSHPRPLRHSRSESDISSSSGSGSGHDEPSSASSTTRSVEQNRAAAVFVTRALPSVGSANHFMGTCQPCSFFRKSRCMLEHKCSHCHYQHEVQTRPGKKARDREKARQARAAATGQEDEALSVSAPASPACILEKSKAGIATALAPGLVDRGDRGASSSQSRNGGYASAMRSEQAQTPQARLAKISL